MNAQAFSALRVLQMHIYSNMGIFFYEYSLKKICFYNIHKNA